MKFKGDDSHPKVDENYKLVNGVSTLSVFIPEGTAVKIDKVWKEPPAYLGDPEVWWVRVHELSHPERVWEMKVGTLLHGAGLVRQEERGRFLLPSELRDEGEEVETSMQKGLRELHERFVAEEQAKRQCIDKAILVAKAGTPTPLVLACAIDDKGKEFGSRGEVVELVGSPAPGFVSLALNGFKRIISVEALLPSLQLQEALAS